jgi:hypothetical protein
VRRGAAGPQHDEPGEYGHGERDEDGCDDLPQVLGDGRGRAVTVAVRMPVPTAGTGAVPTAGTGAVSAAGTGAVPATETPAVSAAGTRALSAAGTRPATGFRAVPTAVSVSRGMPVAVTAVLITNRPALATTAAVFGATGPMTITAAARLLTSARPVHATEPWGTASVPGPLSMPTAEVAGVSRTLTKTLTRARTPTRTSTWTRARAGYRVRTRTGATAAAGAGAGTVAVSGTRAAGRFGWWVRGMVCRGHRPIIARTKGALCSPRPNCR